LEHAVLIGTERQKNVAMLERAMVQSKPDFCDQIKARPDAGTLFEKLFMSLPDAIVVVGSDGSESAS